MWERLATQLDDPITRCLLVDGLYITRILTAPLEGPLRYQLLPWSVQAGLPVTWNHNVTLRVCPCPLTAESLMVAL